MLYSSLFLQERKIELLLDGQPAGQLFAKCVFLPAGKLSFVCEAGRGLRETSAAGRMDPYVTFKADGQVGGDGVGSILRTAIAICCVLCI